MTCSRCGTEVPPESRFCLHCGRRLVRRSSGSGSVPERLQTALGEDFRVGDEIGRGGFAIVYRVDDLRVDRQLAVKVIRPEVVSSDLVVARFQREATIVAHLKHPCIAQLAFAGEGEGLLYCAMPLIQGETLRERLRDRGAMSVDETLRLLTEIGDGLEHAHERGIIHRDIKPANIMLDAEADDRAVLLDFGIAKGLAPKVKLSISGQVIGSPEYMSPERIAGSKDIDARSDIYSVGVVAYEMLTAKLPYRYDTETNRVRPQPGVRSAVDVRAARQDVPSGLAQAIERALRPNAGDRWQTMAEFVDAATA